MNDWLASLALWARALRFIGRPCIVVTRFAGIGDVLCLLPAAAKLKQQYPGCALIFVTSRACAPLVALSGVADLTLPSFTRGLRRLTPLLRPFLAVSPQLPDELSPKRPRARIHLAEEFARSLGMSDTALLPPRLQPKPGHITKARALIHSLGLEQGPFAVIHTGPTWPVKQWPQQHWVQLVEQLLSSGVSVVQIGARRDDRDTAAAMPAVHGVHDLRDQLTLLDALALLGLANIFIGIDSGMLHLAGAAGTPLIGIFGPTDAHCFLPRRDDAFGISGPVECLGCHHHPLEQQHWRSGCPHDIRCMSRLSPKEVLDRTLAVLSKLDTNGNGQQ